MPLRFSPDALGPIPRHDLNRVRRKIEWLWENRQTITHLPLSHNLAGFRKRRLGRYRIIYTFDAGLDDMVIHLVDSRDTIYETFAP